MGFPPKILVNGRVIEDKFPYWFDVLRGSSHDIANPVQEDKDMNGPIEPRLQTAHTNYRSESRPRPQRNPSDVRSDTDEDDRETSMQMDGYMGANEAETGFGHLGPTTTSSPSHFRP